MTLISARDSAHDLILKLISWCVCSHSSFLEWRNGCTKFCLLCSWNSKSCCYQWFVCHDKTLKSAMHAHSGSPPPLHPANAGQPGVLVMRILQYPSLSASFSTSIHNFRCKGYQVLLGRAWTIPHHVTQHQWIYWVRETDCVLSERKGLLLDCSAGAKENRKEGDQSEPR